MVTPEISIRFKAVSRWLQKKSNNKIDTSLGALHAVARSRLRNFRATRPLDRTPFGSTRVQKCLRPVAATIFATPIFAVARSGQPEQNAGMGTILLGILLAIVAFIVIAGLFAIGQYNGLVALRNRFKNAFAQIDVQLKRRYDLIPNLVETAKGYIQHERETLEAVTQARNLAQTAGSRAAANPGDPEAMKALSGAESGLTGALGRFLAVAESYPDLKANQNMMQLSEELTSTENKVAFARQAYNDSVMSYNTKREVFPTNIIASLFQFQAAELFQIDNPEEKQAPKVTFS